MRLTAPGRREDERRDDVRPASLDAAGDRARGLREAWATLGRDLARSRASDRGAWLKAIDPHPPLEPGAGVGRFRAALGMALGLIGMPIGFFGGAAPGAVLAIGLFSAGELLDVAWLFALPAMAAFFAGGVFLAFPLAFLVPAALYTLVVAPARLPRELRRATRGARSLLPVAGERPPVTAVLEAIELVAGAGPASDRPGEDGDDDPARGPRKPFERWRELAADVAARREHARSGDGGGGDAVGEAGLRAPGWREQVLAFADLTERGDEVAAELVPLAREGKGWPRAAARELLGGIADDFTHHGAVPGTLVCSRCLTGASVVELGDDGGDRDRYLGCRSCHRHSTLLSCPRGVVAVLDPAWPPGPSTRLADGRLRVDWRARREPFDLDRVEIGAGVSDADVEELCIDCGNDPDPERRARYREARVALAPGAVLSANSRALLERTFAAVDDDAP